MKLFLKLDMTSDAFVESYAHSIEAARILRELAKRIEGHPHFSEGHEQCLLDANGNEVGFAGVYDDRCRMEIIRRCSDEFPVEPHPQELTTKLPDVVEDIKIKVGDKVKQIEPQNEAEREVFMVRMGQHMSINTPYEVEAITPKGMLVLKDFLCLVGQDEVEKI